jgi:hypothetical protein
MKLDVSLQFFRKHTQIYFTKIRPVGAEFSRTDRRDEANSRFSQFSERV